jgi:hypothetical protein
MQGLSRIVSSELQQGKLTTAKRLFSMLCAGAGHARAVTTCLGCLGEDAQTSVLSGCLAASSRAHAQHAWEGQHARSEAAAYRPTSGRVLGFDEAAHASLQAVLSSSWADLDSLLLAFMGLCKPSCMAERQLGEHAREAASLPCSAVARAEDAAAHALPQRCEPQQGLIAAGAGAVMWVCTWLQQAPKQQVASLQRACTGLGWQLLTCGRQEGCESSLLAERRTMPRQDSECAFRHWCVRKRRHMGVTAV